MTRYDARGTIPFSCARYYCSAPVGRVIKLKTSLTPPVPAAAAAAAHPRKTLHYAVFARRRARCTRMRSQHTAEGSVFSGGMRPCMATGADPPNSNGVPLRKGNSGRKSDYKRPLPWIRTTVIHLIARFRPLSRSLLPGAHAAERIVRPYKHTHKYMKKARSPRVAQKHYRCIKLRLTNLLPLKETGAPEAATVRNDSAF